MAKQHGKFKLESGGIATVIRRSPESQTNSILNSTSGDAVESLVEMGFGEHLKADTASAIDELANGTDLEPIKRRLAAQIIQDDATSTFLTELGLLLIVKPNTMDTALSTLRTASKLRDSSRKGLVALAEIKQPKKTTFIGKQQNLAVMQASEETDDRNLKTLEESEHGRVDFGTQTSGTGKNGESETMEAVYRPKKSKGKASIQQE